MVDLHNIKYSIKYHYSAESLNVPSNVTKRKHQRQANKKNKKQPNNKQKNDSKQKEQVAGPSIPIETIASSSSSSTTRTAPLEAKETISSAFLPADPAQV